MSYYAVVSGMLASAVAAIKSTLDKYPDPRAQVRKEKTRREEKRREKRREEKSRSAPHMMVVGDIDNIFLPVSDVSQ